MPAAFFLLHEAASPPNYREHRVILAERGICKPSTTGPGSAHSRPWCRCATGPASTHSSFCRGMAGRAGRSSCTAPPTASPPPMRATRPTAPGPGCRARMSRCADRSCAAGAISSHRAMSRFTRTPAAGTAQRVRIGSTPTTQRTGTIPSNGSPASPGQTSGSACQAPRRPRRRPSPRHRPGIRACARSSRKPAPPASTTMSFTRASRSRWSGSGCGWRAISRGPPPPIARPSCSASELARSSCRPRPTLPQSATPGSMPRATPTRLSSARRIGCACR